MSIGMISSGYTTILLASWLVIQGSCDLSLNRIGKFAEAIAEAKNPLKRAYSWSWEHYGDCDEPKMNNTWKVIDVDYNVGYCQIGGPRASVYQAVPPGLGEGKEKFCLRSVMCPDGTFRSNDTMCDLGWSDCYHETGCSTPKHIKLPKDNCQEQDWESFKPPFCAIGKWKTGCSLSSTKMEVPYIIDRNGAKRYVRELSIREEMVLSGSDAYWEPVDLYTASGSPSGDYEYCKRIEGVVNGCLKPQPDGVRPYRFFNWESIARFLILDTCKAPIYCYKHEEATVYMYERQLLNRECSTCKAECLKDSVVVTVPTAGAMMIQVCGREECFVKNTTSAITSIPRSFHSRIYDERVNINIHDTLKEFQYTLSANCFREPICDAIDCYFCKVLWLNPSCYNVWNWVVLMVVLYFSMMMVGTFLLFATPIFRVLFSFIRLLFRFFLSIIKDAVKVTKKIFTACLGGMKTRAGEMDDLNPVYRSTITTRGAGAKINMTLVILTIMLMLSVVLGDNNQTPCTSTTAYNIPSTSCSRQNGKMSCKVSTIVDVPLISYDQTTCLHMISETGQIMSQIQVTPTDLRFTCMKRTKFWTRDLESKIQTIMRCPGAGSCSPEWCGKMYGKPDIADLNKPKYPFLSGCKLGPACAAMGCFLCTESCHSYIAEAAPKSNEVFEVFSCLKWEPSASIYVTSLDQNDLGRKISLINGETYDFSPSVKLTLKINVQSKHPTLNKDFVTDGERMSFIEPVQAGETRGGSLAQYQCNLKEMASAMDKNCLLASDFCDCDVSGTGMDCKCKKYSIEDLMKSDFALPVFMGDDSLSFERDVPLLKTKAFGSGSIQIRAIGTYVIDEVDQQPCKVEINSIDGCYSCSGGANLSYTCNSIATQSIILKCSDNHDMVLECSNEAKTKYSRFISDVPIVNWDCVASCDKSKIKIQGNLKGVGLPQLNSAGHIVLNPESNFLDLWSWFKSLGWGLGWFYSIVVGLFIIGIIFVIKFISGFLPSYHRKMQ